MGNHSAAADLGKGKADRRTNVRARRGRRSSPPSDRRSSLRQSGVGGVVAGGLLVFVHEPRRNRRFMLERPGMKVILIATFGSPAEVVKADEVPDVGAPSAGEGMIA